MYYRLHQAKIHIDINKYICMQIQSRLGVSLLATSSVIKITQNHKYPEWKGVHKDSEPISWSCTGQPQKHSGCQDTGVTTLKREVWKRKSKGKKISLYLGKGSSHPFASCSTSRLEDTEQGWVKPSKPSSKPPDTDKRWEQQDHCCNILLS